MSREDAHREIREILELLELSNNRIFLNDENISELDLAQMRQHARDLYTQIDRLELSGINDKVDEKKVVPTEVIEQIKVSPVELEPETEEETIEPEVHVEEEIQNIEFEPKHNEEPSKSDQENVPVEEDQAENEIFEADLFSQAEFEAPKEIKVVESEKTKKANKTPSKEDLYERLQNSKIESIKSSISISKRYEIQEALFTKNPDIYNSSIKELDQAENFEAAQIVFEQLRAEFKWEDENELVEELQSLLLRRFA